MVVVVMEIIIKYLNVLIDDEDLEKVHQFNWQLRSQHDDRQHYFSCTVKGERIQLHRLLVDAPDNMW